ncbi:MAG: hypothetical protein GY820_00540 [Gammaproteobacteria bacterium]|nr:hypothetical protein [Gammaproteobacteria bacterium]
MNEAGKNPGGITRALNRPDGIEIDGRYHDAETVGDFLGDLEDVPFFFFLTGLLPFFHFFKAGLHFGVLL